MSFAIATTVLNLENVFNRKLAQLETTSFIQLRRATDLALEALETVQKINKKLTEEGTHYHLEV